MERAIFQFQIEKIPECMPIPLKYASDIIKNPSDIEPIFFCL